MKNNDYSRRRFLQTSGRAALSIAALAGSVQLEALAQASAQSNNTDYKALVCILFAGGADSFNMLIPSDAAAYAEYRTTRTDLAIPQASLLSLGSGGENNGKALGLHPQMTGLQSLFMQGKLAFLSNVGTLVEPTSTRALQAGTAKLPLGLYSHSDQISQWQTAVPDARSGSGWGGRIADLLSSQNTQQAISMNISTAGSNEFQAGRNVDSYSITAGANATPELYGYGESDSYGSAIEEIYRGSFHNIFRRSYSSLFNTATAANAEFAAALKAGQPLTTQFANDELAQQLHTVARTIAANKLLGVRRQTFFVTYGGWDHHDEVLNSMNSMLANVNGAMVSFQAAMDELGLANNVTTFTTSDFARTLSSNGRGSDHGWGGNAMIMGGAVNGGSVFGQYPSLALNNPLDTGRGVLMPTTSLDQYFADLALWFGVPASFLPDVLPNIGRFYDVASAGTPLGRKLVG